MILWTEVSSQPSLWRFESLSREISSCGVENEFVPTIVESSSQLGAMIEHAKRNFSQIRIAPEFAEKALEIYPDLPADLLNLRAIDSLVPELGIWWPRCFYFDGIIRSLVRDLKELDLSGGVFIMGATWETRVLVAALTKAGFNKFVISDVDELRGQKLVRELERLNFGVHFQFLQRAMVTQLPGTSTLAANLLSLVEYPDLVADLSYLNFLRPDGVWLETHVYNEGSPLITEAVSLGTQVETPLQLISNVDEAWAERCFAVKVDCKRYLDSLTGSLKIPS